MINKYLKWLNEESENESVGGFAIDSFPTKADKKPLPVVYPESVDIENNFDISTKRIMIDFDSVIHKYSKGWLDGNIYDEPNPGVKNVIKQFRDEGSDVIVFTSRMSETAHGKEGVLKQKTMIENWLKKYKIEVDGITAEKLPASAYVDDRAVFFIGQWDKETVDQIRDLIKKKS